MTQFQESRIYCDSTAYTLDFQLWLDYKIWFSSFCWNEKRIEANEDNFFNYSGGHFCVMQLLINLFLQTDDKWKITFSLETDKKLF